MDEKRTAELWQAVGYTTGALKIILDIVEQEHTTDEKHRREQIRMWAKRALDRLDRV